MKIAIQILLLIIYTAPGLQAQKITVSYEGAPLNSVLRDLCFKTRISYIADAECLNFTYPVTLKNSLSLDELLKEIFSHQPVDYRIIKNCIIVTPKNIVGKVIDQNGEPLSGVIVERKTCQAILTDKNGWFTLQRASCDAYIKLSYAQNLDTIWLSGKTDIVIKMKTTHQDTAMSPIDSN